MRSFYAFIRTSEDELFAWLDSAAQRTPGTRQWIYPSQVKRVLYIELANELCDELEPDTMRSLLEHFHEERPHSVCVDVSRHYSAEREVNEFAAAILRQFGGVAIDDESDHLWTVEKIEAGEMYQGRRFFGITGAA